MSAPKWLPKDLQFSYHLFGELEQMVTTFRCLGKRFAVEMSLKDPETNVNIALHYQLLLFAQFGTLTNKSLSLILPNFSDESYLNLPCFLNRFDKF